MDHPIEHRQTASSSLGAALAFEHVSRTYGTGERRTRALDDVSVSMLAGTFTAIVGPSGSGKSTLLQCGAGLDTPDHGRVAVAGTDLTGLDEGGRARFRRAHIGVVFQNYNLLAPLTARANVALPERLAGRRVSRAACREALHEVGLDGVDDRRPAELSGGQRQRVAIARALVTRPNLVLADEPTGALDRAAGSSIVELLERLVGDHGRTVVVVTHDPVVAARADRVLVMADGRLVEELIRPGADTVGERLAHIAPTGAATEVSA